MLRTILCLALTFWPLQNASRIPGIGGIGTGISPPSFVQYAYAETNNVLQTSIATSGTNTTAFHAFASNVGANHILVCGASISGGTISGTIADTLGLTWTASPSNPFNTGDNDDVYIWTAPTGAGGADTITLSWTGAQSFVSLGCPEYSGAALAGTQDTQCTGTVTAGTAVSCSLTTTQTNDMVVAFVNGNTTGANTTPGASETVRIASTITTVANGWLAEERVAASAGAITSAGAFSVSVNGGIIAVAIKHN